MSTKYVYRITWTDPNDVGLWPPSFSESSWMSDLKTVVQEFNDNDNIVYDNISKGVTAMFFASREELDNFVNNYRLQDEQLKQYLALWWEAHQITVTEEFLEVHDLSTPPSNLLL
jgi:hypothetical protein